MIFKKLIVSLLLPLTIIGCATGGANQTGGTLIGGATGAVIGSQFGKGKGQLVAVALGALGGAMLGGNVGKHMDEKDKQLAQQATQHSLNNQPDNHTTSWDNPNNNHHGAIRVTKTQYVNTNKVCRDYVHTVIIDGKEEKVHGRACRDVRANGIWEPVS